LAARQNIPKRQERTFLLKFPSEIAHVYPHRPSKSSLVCHAAWDGEWDATQSSTAAAIPPNNLIFLVDDLSWSDVGFHGGFVIATIRSALMKATRSNCLAKNRYA